MKGTWWSEELNGHMRNQGSKGFPKDVDNSLSQIESEGHSLEHCHIAQITIKQELMTLKRNV